MLGGLAAAGLAAPVLAACGSSGTNTPAAGSGGGSGGGSGAGGGSGSGGSGSGGSVTVKKSSVPVGGGVIDADAQLVVTQPEAGTFEAFSAVCPHQGCLVSQVQDGLIVCPCHGSEFKITDGSVVRGPASRGAGHPHRDRPGRRRRGQRLTGRPAGLPPAPPDLPARRPDRRLTPPDLPARPGPDPPA